MGSSYKFNVVLDSLRLIKGIMAPSKMDPFIEQRFSRVTQRDSLFQWSMLDNEVGDYDQHYPDYIPYQSSQPLLMQHLPERYARDAYQHLMRAKPHRLAQIKELLESAGITVAPNDESWGQILAWLNKQCVASNEPAALAHNSKMHCEFSTRPVVYSLFTDIGLLLGEHAIELRPDFSWAFWGDVPMQNPENLGREVWVLAESLPQSGQFGNLPSRFLPMKLVSITARAENPSAAGLLSSLCQ